MGIKVSSFEVIAVKDAEFKEAADRWHELRHQVRLIRNSLTSYWFNHHLQNDSPTILTEWMRRDREWAKFKNESQRWEALPKAKRGKKPNKPRGKTRPKSPVEALPKELGKQMYSEMTRRFPNMGTRFVSYVIQIWRSNLIGKNATNSAYRAWICVLTGLQSRESADRDAPIPFDRQLCELLPPDDGEKFYSAVLKLSRIPSENTKQGKIINDRLIIRCGGKKIQSQLKILSRIIQGTPFWDSYKADDLQWRKAKKAAEEAKKDFTVERPEPPKEYAFKGSQLVYKENKRKWFLAITYEMPPHDKPKSDPDKTAFLHASKVRPLTLRLPGTSFKHWPGGYGDYIGGKRRRTFLQRRNRSSNYRFANTNGKGHGHDRAHKWRHLFQLNWNDFVKTVNGQMVSSIMRKLVDNGIGQLVYFEPDERIRGGKYLSRTGKDKRWNDATTWDWYGLKKQLRDKCDELGIAFIEKPVGVKRKEEMVIN